MWCCWGPPSGLTWTPRSNHGPGWPDRITALAALPSPPASLSPRQATPPPCREGLPATRASPYNDNPMIEPPKGAVLNRHEMTIDLDGRIISGTYTVWADTLTVTAAYGNRITRIGRSRSPRAVEWLAKVTLREMAIEGKA
jgi:hypothetical protein